MSKISAVVVKEIREALPPMIFFLFLFHLIALTKAVVLDEHSITMLRAVGATVGALIVAKAILVVEALPLSGFFADRRANQILWKAFIYSLVVILFRLLEEAIPLLIKHGDVALTLKAVYHEIHWPLFTVTTLWVFGGLILYCVVCELVDALGPGGAKAVFFGSRNASVDQ